jgi:hypothetical protein
LIDTGSAAVDPDAFDFATTTGTSNTIILRANNLAWASFTDYDFLLNFSAGMFQVQVSQNNTVLENWLVSDSTFTGGDFGFFNQSQPSVLYTGFTVTSEVPEPGTLVLFGIGLAAFRLIYRQRRKLTD